MIKIRLINMPFAQRFSPSIALTQLQGVITNEFQNDIDIGINYLNNEIAMYLGTNWYDNLCEGNPSNYSGFGDWFFRQVAFPQLVDNTDLFFQRYSSMYEEEHVRLYKEELEPKRRGLDIFLTELIAKYSLADSHIVGFTSMFMQNVSCFALARLLKKANPNITIIMGGANCEYPMGGEIVKNVDFIDYVFSGPSLTSFVKFVELYRDSKFAELDKIDGILSKTNLEQSGVVSSGSLSSGKIKYYGNELDINTPIELRYESFLDDYRAFFSEDNINKPFLFFETSRGCWWGARAHCTFCGLNGASMAYRAMDSSAAVKMLNGLFEKYSLQVTHFESVDNIIPKEYLKEVFPKLTVPDPITLFYEVKADLSEEEVHVLSDARVLEIQPGIEALATSTLKLMKKGTTAFTNIKLLQNSIKYGIWPVWNLLVGFPSEKQDVYEKYTQDLPLLYHLPSPQGVFPVRFDRFSPYFTKSDQYQLALEPLDYYDLIYPFEKSSLRNLAYYFYDCNYSAEYIQDMLKWIDHLKQLIDIWKEKWVVKDKIPQLYTFQRDTNIYVYDSRFGNANEYEISSLQYAMLQNLTDRKNKLGLFTDLKHVDEEQLEESLSFLRQKGLIFEETGTMVSLNHFSKPQLKDCYYFHRPNFN